MSVVDLFEVSENDTVWDAWPTAANLLDMLDRTHRVGQYYDFAQARHKIAKLCALAEAHSIDRNVTCKCSLSDSEHALLRRKMITFFRLQVANLKHFVY